MDNKMRLLLLLVVLFLASSQATPLKEFVVNGQTFHRRFVSPNHIMLNTIKIRQKPSGQDILEKIDKLWDRFTKNVIISTRPSRHFYIG